MARGAAAPTHREGAMRTVAVLLILSIAGIARADDDKPGETRFGIPLDAKSYPQATAKEALASVLKAIAGKRIDYLLAQLVDPAFVDDRVKRLYGGQFAEQVAETQAKLTPPVVKQLQKFADSGEWTESSTNASIRLKDVDDRAVLLKKIGT